MDAVVFVPDFALQAVLRLAPGSAAPSDRSARAAARGRAAGPGCGSRPVGLAVALVDGAGGGGGGRRRDGGQIVQVTAAARLAGVEPGVTSAQAAARCPGIAFRHRSPTAERVARQILLRCCYDLSPWIEETAPGIVTVGGAPGRLPETGLTALRARLAGHGLTARVAVATHPDLALLAAVADPAATGHELPRVVATAADAESFLARVPTAALGHLLRPGETAAAAAWAKALPILTRWGVTTAADFLALPAAPAAARLGAGTRLLRERLAGAARRTLRYVRPPPVFEEGLECEREIAELEPLLFLLRRFIDALVARLAETGLVVAALRLRLTFGDGTRHERPFIVPSPTGDAGVLFRMLDTHLENFRAAAPITAVHLRATPGRPSANQDGLFDRTLRDPNRFAETVARLTALLGEDRVGEPEVAASYRPDAVAAARIGEWGTGYADTAGRPPAAAPRRDIVGLMLRRLRPPQPVRVEERAGRPAAVAGMAAAVGTADSLRVVAAAGPWRLSGGWWDGRAWSREEWDVALADQNLYRLSRTADGWSLEGVYD